MKRYPILTNELEDEVKSPRGKSSPRKQEKKKSTTRNIKNDEQQGPADVWTLGKVLLSRPQGQLPSSYQQSECFPKHFVLDNVWKNSSYYGVLKDKSADVCYKMGCSNGVDEKRPKK